MLKYQNLANVGDIIRAQDFMGIEDQFLVGKVVAKGEIKHPVHGFYMYDGYTVEIVGKKSEENGYDIGETAYVPFETSLEYDGRVRLVLTQDEIDTLLIAEEAVEVH